jgi:outer membrane protein insertion porin family
MLGQASLRGFSFGGFGPRDLAVATRPALGGQRFATLRFDAQFPNAFGGGDARVIPGVFADVGSLWDLDNVNGGIAGADVVDDSAQLRASLGVTFRINTGIGPIRVYFAHPVEEEVYDETEVFGLSFSRRF